MQLPRSTPSLEGLDPAEVALTGVLPGGGEGTLARHSYRTDTGDGQTSSHQTVVVMNVGESVAFLPMLYCRDVNFRRTRTYALGAEGFRSEYRSEEFESEAVNRRYAVQVRPDQDALWLRELFGPKFLDWLGEHTPVEFTFELVEGTLCGRMPGRLDDPAQLDQLCELTSYVAERIRTESLEEEQRGASFDEALPPPELTEDRRKADAAVAKLEWPQPPPDMISARRAYIPIARDEPGGWGPALKVGVGIGLLVLIITLPFSIISGAVFGDFGEIASAVAAVAIVAFAVGLGGFLVFVARRNQVQRRANTYGQRAFVHEYARSRGLEPEDAKAFQARFLRLRLPGPARHVLRGRLPGTNLTGRLVICSDPAQATGGFLVALAKHASGEIEQAVRSAPADTGPTLQDLDAVCGDLAGPGPE